MAGGLLGAVCWTVKVKDVLEVFKPSLTKTVISALPVRPLAGVIVTVRFCPLPPKTMLPGGTSVVSEDVAVTVKLEALDSASLTVNPMAVVVWFIKTACGAIAEIEGRRISSRHQVGNLI